MATKNIVEKFIQNGVELEVPTKTSDLTNDSWFIDNTYHDSTKQDSLTTQTAYNAKWTTTKVPQITTNTLWQVTWITEKNIAFPVTSVNWQTGAVTWLLTSETVVSGDSWVTYTIKKSTTAPTSATNTTITLVVE